MYVTPYKSSEVHIRARCNNEGYETGLEKAFLSSDESIKEYVDVVREIEPHAASQTYGGATALPRNSAAPKDSDAVPKDQAAEQKVENNDRKDQNEETKNGATQQSEEKYGFNWKVILTIVAILAAIGAAASAAAPLPM